uniref:Uncharacterized protein n=1 Tax=Arundo donax TaxID=35708 RepID=A0A0A9HH56_ARUDO
MNTDNIHHIHKPWACGIQATPMSCKVSCLHYAVHNSSWYQQADKH